MGETLIGFIATEIPALNAMPAIIKQCIFERYFVLRNLTHRGGSDDLKTSRKAFSVNRLLSRLTYWKYWVDGVCKENTKAFISPRTKKTSGPLGGDFSAVCQHGK